MFKFKIICLSAQFHCLPPTLKNADLLKQQQNRTCCFHRFHTSTNFVHISLYCSYKPWLWTLQHSTSQTSCWRHTGTSSVYISTYHLTQLFSANKQKYRTQLHLNYWVASEPAVRIRAAVVGQHSWPVITYNDIKRRKMSTLFSSYLEWRRHRWTLSNKIV